MKKKYWNFAVALVALLFATQTSQGQFKNKTSVHDNHVNLTSKNHGIFGFTERLHNSCPDDREMVTFEENFSFNKDDYDEYFAGGTGTAEDPWLIETAEHLNNIRLVLSWESKFYKQVANINLGVAPWNEGEGWEPIVAGNNSFQGIYDGNGFVIDQLTINRPDSDECGLFGYIMDSHLKNIQITNASILSNSKTGVLAGSGIWSIIENSSSTGNIFAMGPNAGGLIGEITDCEVGGCFSAVNIESDGTSVGGLFGKVTTSFEGFIENSYATGNTSGTWNVGGLIGWNIGETPVINSYASGYVNASGRAGGLTGSGSASHTITNSYWNIETTAQLTNEGGEGKNTSEMISEDTFVSWNFETTWTIAEGETYPYLQWQGAPGEFNYPIVLLSPNNFIADAEDEAIILHWLPPSIDGYIGFNLYRDGELIYTSDGETLDYIDTNVENFLDYTYSITAVYPGAQESHPLIRKIFATPGFSQGDGTEENPYLVSNAAELFTVRNDLSAYYAQTADIDLGVAPWNIDGGWKTITNINYEPFKGHYNGNDYTIFGLTINRPDEFSQGLFYGVVDGSITNLKISDSHITANSSAGILAVMVGGAHISNIIIKNSSVVVNSTGGGLVAQVSTGSLENIECHVDVTVTNSGSGGIAGSLQSGTLKNAKSSGNVFAGSEAGGLVGYMSYSSTISNAYSTADVSVEHQTAGGLVGFMSNSHLNNSYANGNIEGDKAGGLIGNIVLDNWQPSTVINNYSTGNVNEGVETGGLVGSIIEQGPVPDLLFDFQNNYWDIQSSGQHESALGEGLTTEEMLVQTHFNNWDFAEIWSNIENETYPYLQWQGEPGLHNYPVLEHQVTFHLNMENAEDFNPDNDIVYITGSMLEWAEPGSDLEHQQLSRLGTTMVWEKTLTLSTGEYSYKYFLNEGWDSGEWTDAPDRQITILSDTTIVNTWGVPEGGTFIDRVKPGSAHVFPNPAIDYLNIHAGSAINRIRIMDITGRIVFNQPFNHSAVQIPVVSFETGLYVVQVYTLDGLMTRKLMIN